MLCMSDIPLLSFYSEFVKRVIAHPSFHNVSYKVAETMLSSMDQGEVIIRPSSKVSEFNCFSIAVGI